MGKKRKAPERLRELMAEDARKRESRAQAEIERILREENCRFEYALTITSSGVVLPQLKIVAVRV